MFPASIDGRFHLIFSAGDIVHPSKTLNDGAQPLMEKAESVKLPCSAFAFILNI